MKQFKSLLIFSFAFILFSCKKSDIHTNESNSIDKVEVLKKIPESVLPSIEPGSASNNRSYTGFTNLTHLSNGDYTDGHIWFSQIIYQTGTYLDGEPAASITFYFNPTATPNVLWSSSVGPYFVYVQGTATGQSYNPGAMNAAIAQFNTAYDAALNGTGPYPYLEDYLPSPGTGELITSGVVVRRHSSSSTFAIAPSTFKPVTYSSGPQLWLFGSLEINGYRIFVGYKKYAGESIPHSGAISYVDVTDVSTSQVVNISGFVGTFTKVSQTSYYVTGEVTLADGTIVQFSGNPGLF